jgi:hypothetical protein
MHLAFGDSQISRRLKPEILGLERQFLLIIWLLLAALVEAISQQMDGHPVVVEQVDFLLAQHHL